MRRLPLAIVAVLALAGCGNQYTNERTVPRVDDWQLAQLYATQRAQARGEGTPTPAASATVAATKRDKQYEAVLADGTSTEPAELADALNDIVATVHTRLATGAKRADVLAYTATRISALMPQYDSLYDTRVEEAFINRIDDELHAVGLRRVGSIDVLFP